MSDTENQQKIMRAVREILIAVGEDPDRAGLIETPERVAKMYTEVFSSLKKPEFTNYKLFPIEEATETVVLKAIPFYSMCEHHLLPFFGTVNVAYVPQHQQVIGLSKISRLVDYCSHRPNVQERLTVMIGKELARVLDPAGVAVTIAARHMCMEMRGINKSGIQTETDYYSGVFKADHNLKQQFLNQVSR